MNEQAMRFRVGLFVLTALVLLGALITLFGRLPTIFKKHNEYTVVFSNAPGVGPGTPVRRSGVRIGEVQDVRLDDATGKVIVRLLIDSQHTIHGDDEAVLAHGLLGSDVTVDFVPLPPVPGRPDHSPLPPGTELAGGGQPDSRTILTQTSQLIPSAQDALNEFRHSLQLYDRLAPELEKTAQEYRDLAKATREIVPELRRTNEDIQTTSRNWGRLGERLDVLVQTNEDKLVKTLDNLNTTLNRVSTTFNDENQKNLSATLRNVRANSERLDSITRNTDEMMRESRETMKRVNQSVARSDEVLANLQQATKPMAERTGSVMRNLDESTQKLNRTLSDVQDLVRGASTWDGSLRRFLTDPSLYNNLNDAACAIDRALPRLDQILHDVGVFADKIARHPESLGIGGAIKPSSGLKDAPSSIGGPWQRP